MHVCVTRPQWVNDGLFGMRVNNSAELCVTVLMKPHECHHWLSLSIGPLGTINHLLVLPILILFWFKTFKCQFIGKVLLNMAKWANLKFRWPVKKLNVKACRCASYGQGHLSSYRGLVYYCHYPTLAREFQGFRLWGWFVFRTLELMDTPTNLANQIKVGHALDQSRSVQSRGPERAHQNNEPSWQSSRADHRLFRPFWDD